mmetsp:Transcript_120305/g.236424  ORF Transcript_120305/g.236424 Transcript_120305/m.236424 type:complete len:375 (+) Transcript_120305:2-1126(+)
MLLDLMCGPPRSHGSTHSNEAWWEAQVILAQVEFVPEGGAGSEMEKFYKFVDDQGVDGWIRSTRQFLSGPPDLGELMNKQITAFTEVRQPYWSKQPRMFITYHAFTVLEIASGELFILLERKTDMLEIVIGTPDIPFAFMRAFRAFGPGRNINRCVDESRQVLNSRVTVRQLFGWIDGPLEERWQPYDMLQANCQHFAEDLQTFLLDPGAPEHNSLHEQVSAATLQDRSAVLAALRERPRLLKHLPDKFRHDPALVMAAVSHDGTALRYAPKELRCETQVVLAALRNDGYVLPYVHPSIRQERELVKTAVKQNGNVLCYCAERHRRDRELVLLAVHQDGYALRFVAGKLRRDPEVLLAAGLQNPVALARATMLF